MPQVEHHDHEQEQHHDGSGIQDHLEDRHQRRHQQVEDRRHGKERGHQEQDGVHRVLFGNGQNRGDDRRGGQYVEDSLFHTLKIGLAQSFIKAQRNSKNYKTDWNYLIAMFNG